MRSTLLTLALTLVLTGAAATVAYLAGRATAPDATAEYERGQRDGERAANAGDAKLARQAHDRGYAEGRASRPARTSRTKRPPASSFAGFGEWELGRWYLVSLERRDDDDLKVAARIVPRRGEWYALCDEPTGLCRRRATAP